MKGKRIIYFIILPSNTYKSSILSSSISLADLLKSKKSNPANDLLVSLNTAFYKIG